MRDIGLNKQKRLILCTLLLNTAAACVTPPKDYLPDENIIFLRQVAQLQPIKHEAVKQKPYEFDTTVEVDPQSPAFLQKRHLENFLQPDLHADAVTYNEIRDHLQWIEDSEEFIALLQGLKLEPDLEEPLEGLEYQNRRGDMIRLNERPHGGGAQVEYYPQDTTLFYVFSYQSLHSAVTQEADTLAVSSKSNIRFGYHRRQEEVTIDAAGEVIKISSSYAKTHRSYSQADDTQGAMLSYYLPQGIRISGLQEERTHTLLLPAWPEEYLQVRIGGYVFAYTLQDQAHVQKIAPETLTQVAEIVKNKTGLLPGGLINVVLPPSLESYARLGLAAKEASFSWYPSAFQTTGVIFMWPPSVPKYAHPDGQSYYWSKEFYATLIHEHVHQVISENTNAFSPLPQWLTEGLALVVESEFLPSSGAYWDTTFSGNLALKKRLPWDEITQKSPLSYSINKARVHCAQSYKMVEYLLWNYGSRKLGQYIRSFKVDAGRGARVEVVKSYKENFEKIYGFSWEENIAGFKKESGF